MEIKLSELAAMSPCEEHYEKVCKAFNVANPDDVIDITVDNVQKALEANIDVFWFIEELIKYFGLDYIYNQIMNPVYAAEHELLTFSAFVDYEKNPGKFDKFITRRQACLYYDAIEEVFAENKKNVPLSTQILPYYGFWHHNGKYCRFINNGMFIWDGVVIALQIDDKYVSLPQINTIRKLNNLEAILNDGEN